MALWPTMSPLGVRATLETSPAGGVFFDQTLRVDKGAYGIPFSINGLEKMDHPLGVFGTKKVNDITLPRFDDIISFKLIVAPVSGLFGHLVHLVV